MITALIIVGYVVVGTIVGLGVKHLWYRDPYRVKGHYTQHEKDVVFAWFFLWPFMGVFAIVVGLSFALVTAFEFVFFRGE